MSEPPHEGVFEVTHEARMLDVDGESICCIIDDGAEAGRVCKDFVDGGFDYNLKGIILRRHDGHQMGCRFVVKGRKHLVDYRCAPANDWISELRRSRRLGIASSAGPTVMMVCDDLWTGDIEGVLEAFYSADAGR